MAISTQDILDLLIAIEQEMSRLYFDFAMLLQNQPEQHAFWQKIAMEEVEHVSFLESESQIIATISELQFAPFINKTKLEETYSLIKKRREEVFTTNFTHTIGVDIAVELEVGFGEDLNRHAIKSDIPKLGELLEALGSKNRGHINLFRQLQRNTKKHI